jgi:hypothetical protein
MIIYRSAAEAYVTDPSLRLAMATAGVTLAPVLESRGRRALVWFSVIGGVMCVVAFAGVRQGG